MRATSRWARVSAALLIAGWAAQGVAQDDDAPSARTKTVAELPDAALVDAWMLRDCADGDQRVLTLELLARGQRLEALFLQRLDAGRPDLAAIEATAREQFRQIREHLAAGATLGLGARQRARLASDTVEAFVARTRKRAEAAWRSAGWSALGLIGGRAGLAYLASVVPDHPAEKSAVDRARTLIQARLG